MIAFTLNGQEVSSHADPDKPLLWVLRDELHLKGTKYGCGVGLCGICTVLLDGEPNHACMLPLRKVAGRAVVTVEGLARKNPALIDAWIAEQVPQCGYCQGGQLLASAALLDRNPAPTDDQIDQAMAGVLCRCGTYPRIRRAIHAAARPVGSASPPLAHGHRKTGEGIALNDFIRIGPAGEVTVVISHSEMGQGSLTGLCMLVAEELEVEMSALHAEFAPADARYKNPLWGEQFTGGSSSIRGEWEPLRRHAAEAREQLIAAAVRHWKVRRGDCRAENGRVVHVPSSRSLAYAELVADAAQLDAPKRIKLKEPEAFRIIGKPTARLDIPDMVAGRTVYGIDVARPGMLVATVVRCPVFGGRLERYDAAAALAVPGVRAVLPIESGVAVAADDFWAASRGRERLRVEWQYGKDAALDNNAIYAALKAAVAQEGKIVRREGYAQRVFKNAALVHQAEYVLPYLAHATLEPMNCVADVRRDGCDVWVGTQSQVDTQKVAARITGLPKKQVRVHTQFLGGGFGRRLETDFVVEAVELSKKLGAPAQVVWTRADDLQHDYYRPASYVVLRAALDAGGRPEAWHMRLAGSELALEGVQMDYAIAHVREEQVEVASALPTGPWRSVGASQNAFAIECFIDELAHAAGRDPFEYRRQLLTPQPRLRGALERVAQMSGWGRALPAGHGLGIAAYRSFGSFAAMVAETAVADGAIRVPRVWAAVDCGIAVNPDAVRAQIEGAIALGLSAALMEEIRIEHGRVAQSNFEDYPILRLPEMPAVEIAIVASHEPPGGVGEPGVPPIAPAVANAVFAASGKRRRQLPLLTAPW
ncbi:MAG: molybdopterin cofactor-binding domain-containing protein [Bacteroidota bacterium]